MEYIDMEYTDKVYTINEITEVLSKVANNYPIIEEIVLYGSYSRNEATHFSDIDLLITRPEDIKAMIMWSFLEDIKECMFKPVEIFRLSNVDKESVFYNKVLKEGVVVYKK